jgi:hypothetical protein
MLNSQFRWVVDATVRETVDWCRMVPDGVLAANAHIKHVGFSMENVDD